MSQYELDYIYHYGECRLCQCQVMRNNEDEHVDGNRHHFRRLDAAKIIAKEGFCRLCNRENARSIIDAELHVVGFDHQTNLYQAPPSSSVAPQRHLQQSKTSSSAIQASHLDVDDIDEKHVDDVPSEVQEIVRTGRCPICLISVPPSAVSAQEHVKGAKHSISIKMKKINWKGEESIQKMDISPLGFQLDLFKGANPCLSASEGPLNFLLEAGQTLNLVFRITNQAKSGEKVYMKHAMGIPAATFSKFGVQVKSPHDRVAIPPKRPFIDNYQFTPAPGVEDGVYQFIAAFQLSNRVVLVRAFQIQMAPRNSSALLREGLNHALNNPYKPKDKNVKTASTLDLEEIERGEPPQATGAAEKMYVRPLGFFDLGKPPPKTVDFAKKLENMKLLDAKSYQDKFRTLLHVEELQMNVDIQSYDRVSKFSTDPRLPQWLRLEVQGLAESRPSVQKGDEILISRQPFTRENHSRKGQRNVAADETKIFSGYVHQVEEEKVFLKFSKNFHKNYVPGLEYHIRFTFNRIPLRRFHQGIRCISEKGVERCLGSSPIAVATSATSAASVAKYGQDNMDDMRLVVTEDEDEANMFIDTFVFTPQVTAVGLDTESAMFYGQPNELAWIQIATPTRKVLLLRVLDEEDLPFKVRMALVASNITKYSIGPESEISRKFSCKVEGMIDVQREARKPGERTRSTDSLLQEYAPHLNYKKDKTITLSNWSLWPLTKQQKDYAAKDAIAAYEVGHAMFGNKPLPGAYSHSIAGQPLSYPKSEKLAPASSSSSSSSSSSASVLPNLGFVSKNLNDLQRLCVQRIVQGAFGSIPYIVFGPPGTGKTTVLVEAIQQLLKQDRPHRILAVAPSNSAADLFVERLSHLDPTQLFRLNAVSRVVKLTPEVVQRFSHVTDVDGKSFGLVNRQRLLSYRVVVTTCTSGSCLSGLGLNAGDFSHIFIDESGHATEPEAMATLGGLIDSQQTKVILGGDPQQLGPIIRSPVALKHGLGMSLLERLIHDASTNPSSCYKKNEKKHQYNSMYMIKLLDNYRSHPSILAVPNRLFYDNELRPRANELERTSLCNWPQLPAKGVPLLLHHINGKEIREAESPSWFNLDEIVAVLNHVEDLLSYKSAGIKEKEIGIITPYHRQAQKLRAMVKGRGWDASALKIGSVEEFQGQERRIIIISTVRSQLTSLQTFDTKFQLGFVNQPKRMNVALTRAKALLIVVGNAKVLETDSNWNTFLRSCVELKAVKGDYKGSASASSSSSSARELADTQQFFEMVDVSYNPGGEEDLDDSNGQLENEHTKWRNTDE